MKNWVTIVPAESVVEIRKLPRLAAERLVASENDRFVAHIVGEASPDLDALKARRDQLLAELADVEKMIAGY